MRYQFNSGYITFGGSYKAFLHYPSGKIERVANVGDKWWFCKSDWSPDFEREVSSRLTNELDKFSKQQLDDLIVN